MWLASGVPRVGAKCHDFEIRLVRQHDVGVPGALRHHHVDDDVEGLLEAFELLPGVGDRDWAIGAVEDLHFRRVGKSPGLGVLHGEARRLRDVMVGVGEEHALGEVGAVRRILALADIVVLRPRIGSAEQQAADGVDRAHQHVEDQPGAPALDAVLLGGQATERIERDRPVAQRLAVDHDGLADAGFLGKHLGEPADLCRRHPAGLLRIGERHRLEAVGEHLEGRPIGFAAHRIGALERRFHAGGERSCRIGGGIPDQRGLAVRILEHLAVLADQVGRVGELDEERLVDAAGLDHDAGHRQQHHDVLAGAHRHPFVGLGGAAGEPRLDHDRLEALVAAHRRLPVEPARRLLALVIVGAEIEQQLGVLEVGDDAGARPGQFVRHVPGGLARRGPVHHVGRAERLGEGVAVLLLDQVFSLAVMPDELARVFRPDLLEPFGDRRKSLVPADLDPLRILVGTFQRVGAPERLLEAIGIVDVVHARRAFRAYAVIVELGARDVGIDRAHDAVDHGRLDAAEVRADRAAGLDPLDLQRPRRRGRRPCRPCRRGDRRKLQVEPGEAARRADAGENSPSTWLHDRGSAGDCRRRRDKQIASVF